MSRASWLTVALLGIVAVLLGFLLAMSVTPTARADVSEGQANKVIALSSSYGDGSLLYLVDTSAGVILVYGYHNPTQLTGPTGHRDMRSGAFEFLAGRLYRWDLLLAGKREYSIRGVRTLSGLRPQGPGSSEEEYRRAGE